MNPLIRRCMYHQVPGDTLQVLVVPAAVRRICRCDALRLLQEACTDPCRCLPTRALELAARGGVIRKEVQL